MGPAVQSPNFIMATIPDRPEHGAAYLVDGTFCKARQGTVAVARGKLKWRRDSRILKGPDGVDFFCVLQAVRVLNRTRLMDAAHPAVVVMQGEPQPKADTLTIPRTKPVVDSPESLLHRMVGTRSYMK